MAGCLQLPKGLLTSADLFISSGVVEAKLLAHDFGQLSAMKKCVGVEQFVDVRNALRSGEVSFDLILCVHSHAVRMHDMELKVQ